MLKQESGEKKQEVTSQVKTGLYKFASIHWNCKEYRLTTVCWILPDMHMKVSSIQLAKTQMWKQCINFKEELVSQNK